MKYLKARVAADPAISTVKDGKLMVALHRREKEPFKEKYELPGGLLRQQESPEERARKKLGEMTGLENIFLQQFGVFAKPDRDPRERTVSVGFVAIISDERVMEDRWFDARKLPKMAFDHREIIEDSISYLNENIDEMLAREFMPEKFPLNKLHRVYEAVTGETYDNRNFRRKMKKNEKLERLDEKQKDVSHRPAYLYTFSDQN